MAQTKSKLSELLNTIATDEGFLLGESTCKLPSGAKKVAVETTGGNLIEAGVKHGDILVIENSAASEYEAEIAAGESPPSLRKGEGKLAVKCASKALTLVRLETARHFDKAGNLTLTYSNASFAGNLAILRFSN